MSTICPPEGIEPGDGGGGGREAGFVNGAPEEPDKRKLLVVAEIKRHRGPDRSGVVGAWPVSRWVVRPHGSAWGIGEHDRGEHPQFEALHGAGRFLPQLVPDPDGDRSLTGRRTQHHMFAAFSARERLNVGDPRGVNTDRRKGNRHGDTQPPCRRCAAIGCACHSPENVRLRASRSNRGA
jgi:hypothetical protein